jgi:pre-mRNA-splicing factor RBM22/SLT11
VVDDLALRAEFEEFGQVKSVWISNKSNCAIVDFAARSAAEACVEAKANGNCLINGTRLNVNWARS